jgi:hypothetical protein
MDMSPGKPNTPAVADENMSVWMDYLYGQNATLINAPPKPNGVTIRLSAIDPNGNTVDIGAVTSDSGGRFKTIWAPKLEGAYTIFATFDGSNSYWGSYSETAVGVTAASTVAPTSSTGVQATPDYTMTIIGTGIAVIIVVAIATVLILRKRP